MSKRILVGFLVVALVGVGAALAIDRTLFAPSPVSTAPPAAATIDRSSLDAGTPTASTPAPAATIVAAQPAVAETVAVESTAPGEPILFAIDPNQSEVRYEVGETFFQDNRFAVAVGRTSAVAGQILVDLEQPGNSQVGEILVGVSQLQSDESRRDNYIRNNALESARYPEAVFTPTAIEGLPASVSIGDTVNFRISGDLKVRETVRPVVWDVSLTVESERLSGTATTTVLMSDFGVGPVQIAFLRTEDEVLLVFDFTALPVQ
jgi:polyisoprenoid-binding protein YceI